MGNCTISLKVPTSFSENELKKIISKKLRIKEFSYNIKNQSLDARNKAYIHWLINCEVFSKELKSDQVEESPRLAIPFKKRDEKVVVVGSGPAGFFAAYVLQLAGFNTTIIERGTEVKKRTIGIEKFESTGTFDPVSNYAFGEGGAGTFSDGKLTSRSKHISKEKRFILESYVKAGAPKEILYFAHPHVGSDNLKFIVENLRKEFEKLGGQIIFEFLMTDFKINKSNISTVKTTKGNFEADYLFIAPGHSSYETYKLLIQKGITFRTKNFAIGSRIEHPQELINMAQWGKPNLPGVKAAEYRLTTKTQNDQQVYTFCMCPGGVVVPATAYQHTNIVNGMSNYFRNEKFANSACVAAIHPNQLLGKEASAIEAINWLENLEQSFYEFSNGYQAPFCSIESFISKKEKLQSSESSYPLGLKQTALWELLPSQISNALSLGLKDFTNKLNGFEQGNIMGLESKTSSPIQVIREKNSLVTGFDNLYIIGEGSGYAGGIISSAADGIKAAMNLIEN